jgi:hypothetical protein
VIILMLIWLAYGAYPTGEKEVLSLSRKRHGSLLTCVLSILIHRATSSTLFCNLSGLHCFSSLYRSSVSGLLLCWTCSTTT